jgi:hypothetical protein
MKPDEEFIPTIDPKNPPPDAMRLAEQIAAGVVVEPEEEPDEHPLP